MSWIIINENELSESLKNGYKTSPVLENSDMCLLEVNAHNEHELRTYIKFNADEIALMRESELIPYNKIDYVTQSTSNAFANKKTREGNSLFKRIHGMGSLELDAGETGDFELEIGYDWVKLEALELIGQTGAITCDLFILDDETGSYSTVPKYMLNQFGFDIEIPLEHYRSTSQYDADLYRGMFVLLQVTNTSVFTQNIRANIELNEVR